MKRRRRLLTLMIATTMFCSPALAQQNKDVDPDAGPPEARLTGYAGDKPVILKDVGSGSFANWAIFIVMAVIGFGVMFKNANRSHLD